MIKKITTLNRESEYNHCFGNFHVVYVIFEFLQSHMTAFVQMEAAYGFITVCIVVKFLTLIGTKRKERSDANCNFFESCSECSKQECLSSTSSTNTYLPDLLLK